ncbi:MAG: hypothetical protein DI596_08835 [Azospira oryzae]|nr:MAG: hypothetical protein DI596_08835 [Azospira oryzae]PZP79236.1 MAG: hypothetical protein DI593_08835 [Azospira oryzae]
MWPGHGTDEASAAILPAGCGEVYNCLPCSRTREPYRFSAICRWRLGKGSRRTAAARAHRQAIEKHYHGPMGAEIHVVHPSTSQARETPDVVPALGQPDRVLVHYAEIGIKGQNRPRFAELLRKNIRYRLHRAGITARVHATHDGMYAEIPPGADVDRLVALVAQVPGIAWLAPTYSLPRPAAGWSEADVERIAAALVALARQRAVQPTFKVRVKRSDKRFPFNSGELARRFGAAIIQRSGWSKVSLEHPDRTFSVHIAREAAYLFTDRVEGIGGLPVGASFT